METKRLENGVYTRETKSLMDEGVGTVDFHRKRKKIYGKRTNVEEVKSSLSDDGAEACSGTGEGLIAARRKQNAEVSNARNERFSQQGPKKRSKKLYFGGED